jgi:hypothetical protein
MGRASLPLFLSLLAVFCGTARAEEDNSGLPSIEVLACEGPCAKSTRAVPLNELKPTYPDIRSSDGYTEGVVRLHYTVGIDGRVHDIVVQDLIGPQSFAENTVTALKERTFQPATIDEKPVEQTLFLEMVFQMKGSSLYQVSQTFINGNTRALRLIRDGKYDEANATLTDLNKRETLNFYERGMIAASLMQIAFLKKDYLAVRELTALPTDAYFNSLSADLHFNLLKGRMQADLALGDIGDALASLNAMKLRFSKFNTDDPVIKLVEEVRAKADKFPQIKTTERIPLSGGGNGSRLLMSHRDFTFQNVSGSLDNFEIQCRQATIRSKVSEVAEWHVPRDWNQCYLFVRGAPGTTFDVVQFASDNPAASR